MKKLKMLFIATGIVIAFASCGLAVRTPIGGAFFTGVKGPFAVTSNAGSSKVGMAQAVSVFGLVAIGDASIQAAAKSAGITKIHHVDEEAFSVFGIYSTYTVYVYGE